jgi:hypothetical protein
MYSQLYNPNSRIIVRTTVSDPPWHITSLYFYWANVRIRHRIACSSHANTFWLASSVWNGKIYICQTLPCPTHLTVHRTRNATIEVIIEQDGFNNSLAGYLNCPNEKKETGGWTSRDIWVQNYLQNGELIRRSVM